MTTQTAVRSPARSSSLPALAGLVRAEVLKLSRVPAFMVPTLAFPIMIFAFFALPSVNTTLSGVNAGQYVTVSYAAYSLMSVALFSFGVSVAAERGLGWTRMLRVTPMPPALYFLGKMLAGMLIGLLSVSLLIAFAILVGHVRFAPLVLVLVVLKLLAGMLPFIALGLFIGYAAGPNSAAAVANLIFFPLSFLSGLLIPLDGGPKFLQQVAPYSPAYHFAQLGWGSLGAKSAGTEPGHWLWLAGYAALFFVLALWAYRRDEGKKYG